MPGGLGMRNIHLPPTTVLASLAGSVAAVMRLKYRTPAYVSFFSVDLTWPNPSGSGQGVCGSVSLGGGLPVERAEGPPQQLPLFRRAV